MIYAHYKLFWSRCKDNIITRKHIQSTKKSACNHTYERIIQCTQEIKSNTPEYIQSINNQHSLHTIPNTPSNLAYQHHTHTTNKQALRIHNLLQNVSSVKLPRTETTVLPCTAHLLCGLDSVVSPLFYAEIVDNGDARVTDCGELSVLSLAMSRYR